MCLMRGRNCLPFAGAWIHPGFGGVRAVGRLCLLTCVFVFAFVFCFFVFLAWLGLSSSCLVYPMLPIALDCPFMIAAKRRDAFIEMASLFLSGLICRSL